MTGMRKGALVAELARVPTRRDETWHYSNLEAVASVWPVQTEMIDVPAGESTPLRSAIIA
jgi:Fe-S cluster assembly protein SufD